MIIPSIDLMNGSAVQLIGGETPAIDAGDPRPLAKRFGRIGEVAVIDLDAALSRGSNEDLIVELCADAPCRVGGGIRSVEKAIEWLDRGARRVILGTAATPEILRELPRRRVIAALDARNGEVMVEGWKRATGRGLFERIEALREHVGGFLITIIEREGRMAGVDLELAQRLCEVIGNDCELTIAGGVRSAREIAALDALGIDAQVGMALYSGAFSLAEGFTAPLRSDRPDGLWPTVVGDERGAALGLAYSNLASIDQAIETGQGVYWSRSRNELWRKGATSGDTQELLRADMDCDRDALRFTVRQHGAGFCHRGTATCFGDLRGLARLQRTTSAASADRRGSYTSRLQRDAPLLDAKLREEVEELINADGRGHTIAEAADVLYFLMVKLGVCGVTLEEVERELEHRALRVSRRGGDAKPPRAEAARRDVDHLRVISRDELPSRRSAGIDAQTLRESRAIVEDVLARGWDAARGYAIKFGEMRGADEKLVYSAAELKEALDGVDRETRSVLERTADRIRAFADAQRRSISDLDLPIPGGVASQRISPVAVAGCYAPGGRYPLPSSVLMTAVTARAAGVERIIVASPKPAPATLAAAAIAGVDAFIAIGGAQAIAMLARGTEDESDPGIPLTPCDVIVGPGNRWVTAAKHIVSDRVGIDMLAGPSELLVIADAHADPEVIAADLLAQAEHDADAVVMLIALDSAIIDRVNAELKRQLDTLATAAVARSALAKSFAVVAASMDDAISIADLIAPEHLELNVRDAGAIAPRFRNYGAMFVGESSAEVFGDYGAGPNHTLPTGGTARFASGLSVLHFLRVRTQLAIRDRNAAKPLRDDAIALARLEGLEGHARSAALRG